METSSYPPEERRTLARIISDPQFARVVDLPVLAWQEIALIAACYATLIGSTALALSGWVPYVLAMIANALAIYAIFTPLHDATHGALSSNRRVNDALGTVAALPLFPGFTTSLYRFLHMEHHKHTGEAGSDPDEVTVSTKMPLKFLAWMFLDLYWIGWYLKRVQQRPRSEWGVATASISFFVVWHAGWLLSPFAVEFVLFWLIPQRLGITLLVYLFASIQHPEGVLQIERPIQATRMIRGGRWARRATLSQAQHLMHHLFPTVPYYRYNDAWTVAAPHLREHEIVWGQILGSQPEPSAATRPERDDPDTLTMTIAETEDVGGDVRAYTLVPTDDEALPAYAPGAHIDVFLDNGLVRQYSLRTPYDGQRYRIAVKREDAGRGGSRALHAEWQPGRTVRIGKPRNLFALGEHDRVILVAGGIGITPLLSMAEALHDQGTAFDFHACARTPEAQPFRRHLSNVAYAKHVYCHYDGPGVHARGALRESDLPQWQAGAALYLCGPEGFMQYVRTLAAARGWPEEAIFTESFANEGAETRANHAFDLVLARSKRTLHIPADRSVLDVLNEEHCAVPAACTQGLCGSCVCQVLDGQVDHRDVALNETARASGQMTVCVSRAQGERLVLDL